MNKELELILDCLRRNDILSVSQDKYLLDYITNIKQDLDKANIIIEKHRRFYKCRMNEYEELKKENARLKRKQFIFETLNYGRFNCINEELKKENKQLKQIIDKATNLYLKTLAEQKQVDDLACDMFNILEGNVK